MNNVISIKISMDQNSELTIHPEKAATLDLGRRRYTSISFGNQKLDVKIKMNPGLSQENVLLSENIVKELHLPNYPVYEIHGTEDAIVVGPFIGLLTSNKGRRLRSSRLNRMLIYVKEYAKLHGAIVIFALDKVDKKNRLIEGYCYNPVKKCWQKGIFPYPSSIYRTIGLGVEWKRHFKSVIGDKIFNSRFFNKWEMYQWFSKEPEINPHIPCTVLYHSPGDVFDMLERFPQIYIKPIFGLQGRGIVRISMEDKMLIFNYRENKINCQVTYEGLNQAEEYIGKRFRPKRYLIQQAIDLLQYKGRIIDFRCVVQKNQSGVWVCRTIIGRSGVKDSIVSNISSGGAAFTVENILRKALSASEEHIEELKKKITAFALTVCSKLDEYKINCGTLGLDIGLDIHEHLWLIEINNRDPDPGIALDVHDVQLYYKLKTGPLLYAKFLAGFKGE